VPLAWALNAAPKNVAIDVVVDYGMLTAALITAGWILWRDGATGPAGFWSGQRRFAPGSV